MGYVQTVTLKLKYEAMNHDSLEYTFLKIIIKKTFLTVLMQNNLGWKELGSLNFCLRMTRVQIMSDCFKDFSSFEYLQGWRFHRNFIKSVPIFIFHNYDFFLSYQARISIFAAQCPFPAFLSMCTCQKLIDPCPLYLPDIWRQQLDSSSASLAFSSPS